ncbi:hypothetical protein [Marinimicrobium alkaliphilum]|uniref:hypothetical protein n=1 Tax=Marinimicrobium alkaliphilum TaxID=2202654 RepID=UPI000DBA7CAF|nr:hypothetical protein [Marinimicrobium alkaliphilum]
MNEVVENLKKYKEQLEPWTKKQNEFVGLFFFSFGLACLSLTGVKALVASVASFLMMGLVSSQILVSRPKAMDKYRFGKNRTEKDRQIEKFFQKEINKISNYLPFLFGITFMFLVLMYNLYVVLNSGDFS